jgi:polyphosphate kinase 2
MAKRKSPKKGSEKKAADVHPKLKRKHCEAELEKLQVELVKLQEWVKRTGAKIVVIFEGRDAAGKGGVIKRITERVSPRVFRVVALPAPNEREKTQFYFQRYINQLPAAGEVILFDRSWYNRAGVERVMGFCTEDDYREFLRVCPGFERTIINSGIQLIKYWLTVDDDEQERRFRRRIEDPRRQWKLSPMDLESRRRWYEYSRARDDMLAATDTTHAPWYIVDSNDKRRARLNTIAHLLNQIPYATEPGEQVRLPQRNSKGAYDDAATLASRRFVPERY